MAIENSIPEIPTKTCIKCKETFPATTEFFVKRRDGLHYYCKPCLHALKKHWRENDLERDRLLQRQKREREAERLGLPIPKVIFHAQKRDDALHECSVCHRLLPATAEFFYTRPIQIGLRRSCKDCRSKAAREKRQGKWIVDVPQLRDDGLRECSSCHEILPETADYYSPCPLSARGLQRQCRKCKKTRRRQTSPLLYAIYNQRRRARKQAKPETFTQEDWRFALEYWQHSCAVCGKQQGFWWNLQADHWIPISDPESPGTVATNIVPLCGGMTGCNQSKRKKCQMSGSDRGMADAKQR